MTNKEPFFRLVPQQINSINNVNMNDGGKTLTIGFAIDADNHPANLEVGMNDFSAFYDKNEHSRDNIKDAIKNFLLSFVSTMKPTEDDNGDSGLEEIIDTFGNIMPDNDEPINSPTKYGNNKISPDKGEKQIVPKSKRYYSDIGLGTVTW